VLTLDALIRTLTHFRFSAERVGAHGITRQARRGHRSSGRPDPIRSGAHGPRHAAVQQRALWRRRPRIRLARSHDTLGFNEIFQLVVSLGTAALLRPPQKGYGIEAGELWRHSVTAAIIGKSIAQERNDNPSLVFTACLLHDIGKIVLSRSLESQYEQVLAETKRCQSPMVVVEQSLLGFDHAEVGAGCWSAGSSRRGWWRPSGSIMTRGGRRTHSVRGLRLPGKHARVLDGFRLRPPGPGLALPRGGPGADGHHRGGHSRYMTNAFDALVDLQALLEIQP